MPTILRIQGFRIGFYQADLGEPPHVHVKRQHGEAKVWLAPVMIASSRGFRTHELNEIVRILQEHQAYCLMAWRSQEKKRGNGSGEDSSG